MGDTKAERKRSRDAKKALKVSGDDPVHQSAEDKPQKLKIRLPPRQEQKKSPEPADNPQDADVITPPPAASPKQLRKAVNMYLRERGRTPHSELEEDDPPSETEILLREKTRTFADGLDDSSEDSNDDSKAAGDEDAGGDDEDEDEEDDDTGSRSSMSSSSSDTEPVPPPKKLKVASKKAGVAAKKKNNPGSVLRSLKFSVPVGGTNKTFTVPPTIPYKDLVTQLADTMSVAPKNVLVAYRFSLQNRGDSFNHLADETHLAELVSNARRTLKTSKSKKEFVVEIRDLSAAAGKKGKAGDKKKAKKKRKRGESSSEDESDDGAGDGKPAKLKPLSGPQWVAKLQAANACTEHGGEGCLKYTTGHVPLSKPDLSTWSVFLQNGYTSTTTPPPKLKIQAETVQPGRKVAVTPVAPGAPPAGMPPFGIPFPYQPYPGQWPLYHTPAPHPKARYDDIPSSDPIEEPEDVTLFPRLNNYLQELDNGPRGQDGHDFAQFWPDFEREKYIRIVDLEGMAVKDLKELVPDIAHGTASKLIGYITNDIKAIRKREAKEKKRARKHPRFT
ncbi:hypothetical protein B0H16DRAFT_1895377 [Mycena metata]|uniref:Uncharacterized protein n=1 Tax=Mycena metata TaxID=1033252 RepID=A0AAD7MN26_9AGAR|nr:hypothetical protein B0H16DRAFT_1895377 [Mycena metata]